MPRLSRAEYEKKLESIRTALIREFTNAEICTAEHVCERTLYRYKATIERRGLKTYPIMKKKMFYLLIKQIQRLEDTIRQVNRYIMANPHQKIAPNLKVIIMATREIVNTMFRAGMIPEMPKGLYITGEIDISMVRKTVKLIAVTIAKEDPDLAERLEQVTIKIPE